MSSVLGDHCKEEQHYKSKHESDHGTSKDIESYAKLPTDRAQRPEETASIHIANEEESRASRVRTFFMDRHAIANDDLKHNLEALWHDIGNWVDVACERMSNGPYKTEWKAAQAKSIGGMSLYDPAREIRARRVERLCSALLKARLNDWIVHHILANPWSGLRDSSQVMFHCFHEQQMKGMCILIVQSNADRTGQPPDRKDVEG